MKKSTKPKSTKRPRQARLPICYGPRPETVEFDRKLLKEIVRGSGKAGQLQEELECSRGKLRLALMRAKKNGYIRQNGLLNGASYVATGSGESFAKGKRT